MSNPGATFTADTPLLTIKVFTDLEVAVNTLHAFERIGRKQRGAPAN